MGRGGRGGRGKWLSPVCTGGRVQETRQADDAWGFKDLAGSSATRNLHPPKGAITLLYCTNSERGTFTSPHT